jgi:hypothetical protein
MKTHIKPIELKSETELLNYFSLKQVSVNSLTMIIIILMKDDSLK